MSMHNPHPQTVTDRELDQLIAEKVMGWTWQTHWGPEEMRSLFPPPNSELGYHPDVPEYSTDLTAAFQVVEKMRELGWSCCIGLNGMANAQNGVKFYEGFRGAGHSIFDAEAHVGHYAVNDTLPLAICKAALRTLGVEVPA